MPLPRARLTQSRPAASAAAAVGVVATSVGAGVGIRYVVKTGLTATSVLGLIMLALGLALLTMAWRAVWRTVHRWRRLWLVPLVLVVLALLMSMTLGTMYSLAPRTRLGSVTPADRGLTYTDVTFRTTDHVLLSAWFVPSTNRAAVVLIPGSGSTRSATLSQAVVLARHGYGALLIDPRGQGRSGGRGMDVGWYGDRDISAAVAFLRHQPSVDPTKIAALGLSMGGEEAIGAAAALPDLRAVIAEGATARTAADKAGWLPRGVAGTVQRGLDWLTYSTTNLLSSAPRPKPLHQCIEDSQHTRFLLITASTQPDEARAARYLRMAAPARVQTWTVDGASHTGGLSRSPEQWAIRVTDFLAATLSSEPT